MPEAVAHFVTARWSKLTTPENKKASVRAGATLQFAMPAPVPDPFAGLQARTGTRARLELMLIGGMYATARINSVHFSDRRRALERAPETPPSITRFWP